MELLCIKGVIRSDSELKKLLTNNFVTIFLDDREIKDNVLFEPLKYITITNFDEDYFRIVIAEPYHDIDIYEIIDVLDNKEDFDLNNFSERHEITIDIDYPLYFCAIYKDRSEKYKDIVTKIRQHGIQIISVKILRYIEEIIT